MQPQKSQYEAYSNVAYSTIWREQQSLYFPEKTLLSGGGGCLWYSHLNQLSDKPISLKSIITLKSHVINVSSLTSEAQ